MICLENTLSGMIFPQDEINLISQFARSNGIKLQLDGARLWHVAIEKKQSIQELCNPFDSVSLCFNKGLGRFLNRYVLFGLTDRWIRLAGAPVGSCLAGTSDFVNKARQFRALFGGDMCQTGSLAASAAYALTHNFPQLPRAHALARKLQAGLESIGVEILCGAETCMVKGLLSTI